MTKKNYMSKKRKIAILALHPVPYHAPLYKRISEIPNYDVNVLYCDRMGVESVNTIEFNCDIKWDIPLLEGYNCKFLENFSKKQSVSGFLSRINLGIIKELLISNYDVILIQGYDTFTAWLGLICAKVLRISIVWRGEATLKNHCKSLSIKSLIKKIFVKIFLFNCNAILFSCTGNKEYLIHYGVTENKLFSFPCAVDNKYFRSQRQHIDPIKIRQKLGINKEDFVVLMAGRLTQRKRPLDLLEALKILNNKNIVVMYVGDGLEKEIMLQITEKHNLRVIFCGFKNQSEISAYYSAANCAAIISEYDPSPKVLNEVMNFSLPVITTEIVGTAKDLVQDGENGFIIKVGDAVSLAEKINFLFKNKDKCVFMGNNSFRKVANWNFDADADGFVKAVLSIVK